MSNEEIMELTSGRETDALVGRAIGGPLKLRWLIVDDERIYEAYASRKRARLMRPAWDKCVGMPTRVVRDEVWPPYSTDLREAYAAEEAIPEHLRGAYGDAVWRVSVGCGPVDPRWALTHATPMERCKALLMTMGGNG